MALLDEIDRIVETVVGGAFGLDEDADDTAD
jgi:hypothetical protein